MIEKYKKIPDLPTGSPMNEDLIPFVKLSTNQTMKAPKAALMGAQVISVAFVNNDMVFTLTNGMEISILNAKLQLRGEAGDDVQLRKTSTHLQWKLVESEEWTDIVSLAEITGPKGDVGAKIVGAGFNGNDLVFILDDASTVTIVDGKLAIKGDNGDTGDAGSVTIGTVTTLPAGSPATVENTGTSKDAILNFGIPEGHKGVTPINAQTGSYTLVLSDAEKFITLTSSSDITLTIPTNASVAFPIGTQIDLSQMGDGKVTFAGAGVTINSKGGNKAIADKFVGVSLIKTDTNTWLLVGDLTA